jgi:hypothetical protein
VNALASLRTLVRLAMESQSVARRGLGLRQSYYLQILATNRRVKTLGLSSLKTQRHLSMELAAT